MLNTMAFIIQKCTPVVKGSNTIKLTDLCFKGELFNQAMIELSSHLNKLHA